VFPGQRKAVWIRAVELATVVTWVRMSLPGCSTCLDDALGLGEDEMIKGCTIKDRCNSVSFRPMAGTEQARLNTWIISCTATPYL